MKFSPPLSKGVLVRRYKRFLADVKCANGKVITAHCPNTGSMTHCNAPGSTVYFSDSGNDKRKYRHTLEVVSTPLGFLAGINTSRANHLAREALEAGRIRLLKGYDIIRSEVPYGEENSRVDFLLQGKNLPDCYMEVKNVTLESGKTTGLFPDAVTSRGVKHLRELAQMVKQGNRAVLFFCVQHTGIKTMAPADDIDPLYGETLRQVVRDGVEVIAMQADISVTEICLRRKVNVRL